MKTFTIIMFISLFLGIYACTNIYIFNRLWQVIPDNLYVRTAFIFVFLYVSLAFITGRLLERFKLCSVSDFSIWSGSIWLAVMVYLFLGFLGVDIFLGFFRISRGASDSGPAGILILRRPAVVIVLIVTLVTVAAGYWNAANPRIRNMDIVLRAYKTQRESLKIVLVTDIHIGTIINNHRLVSLVNTVNGLNPDIVLLAGDIIDEDLKPVIEQDTGRTLKNIRSRYGVYAVTGNHEYIGGVEQAVRYLREHGINVLRDESVVVGNAINLVGREDRSAGYRGITKRKSLTDILSKNDRRLPVIVMDHQPYGLSEAVENNVDLQLSGHTHHGQLWPFNYITGLIYEISWGYARYGNTQLYVSCGYGTWGPPVRTGNRPEVINISLKFH